MNFEYSRIRYPLLLLLIASVSSPVTAQDTCQTAKRLKVDKAYSEVAEATGGTMIYIDPDEVLKAPIFASAKFLGAITRDSATGIEIGNARILRISGPVKSSGLRRSFQVDSSVTKLLISFNATSPSRMKLFLPQNKLVREGTGNIKIIPYSSGCVLQIMDIEKGEWQIHVESQGSISLDVEARTPIRFEDFHYVEWGGRPAHEGWFKVREEPLVGSAVTAQATVFGDKIYRKAKEFQVRSLYGEVLQSVTPSRQSEWRYLLPSLKVPEQASRIYFIGEDKEGRTFERMFPFTLRGRLSLGKAVKEGAAQALIDATLANDLQRIAALIAKGAHVNARGENGSTALMWAVGNKDNKIVRFLLDKGADVNIVTKHQGTAIFRATVSQNADAARLLLEHGANPNIRDGSGYTAYEWARKKNLQELMEILETAPGVIRKE